MWADFTYLFHIIFCVFVLKLQFFYWNRLYSEYSMRWRPFTDLPYYSKRSRSNSFENIKLLFKRSRRQGNLRLLLCIIDDLFPSLEGTSPWRWLLLRTIIQEVWYHKGWILKLTIGWSNQSFMKIHPIFFCIWHRILRSVNCLLSSESITPCCWRCRHLSDWSKPTIITKRRDITAISFRLSSWDILFLDNWYERRWLI